jgi:hypothetical protein
MALQISMKACWEKGEEAWHCHASSEKVNERSKEIVP